jgi:hypothetical protein
MLQTKFSHPIIVNDRLVIFHFCMVGCNADEYEVRSGLPGPSHFNMVHCMVEGLRFQYKNTTRLPRWMTMDTNLQQKLNDAILNTW